jgi:hypothetical protein
VADAGRGSPKRMSVEELARLRAARVAVLRRLGVTPRAGSGRLGEGEGAGLYAGLPAWVRAEDVECDGEREEG